jgi:para-nitrobenzyl esterase
MRVSAQVRPRASVARGARVTVATVLSVFAFLPTIARAQIQSGTLVHLADGDVQGQVNGGTREFLGIPYAAPPVGPLRWSRPVPATPWVGTLDATHYSSACPQLPAGAGTPSENEDCLYLNVWTPDPAPAAPKPVMIWIHGGGNLTGSTGDLVPFPGFEDARFYDGHTLAGTRDVVIVTVNYRLGVFGFFGHSDLTAEDPGFPYAGNQGLLDQRAAMQWVQNNIAAFGGDPNNVTIFGESAGSFDVCTHVVSPMSAGLFHRAISESGGCTVGILSDTESAASADTLAATVGCDTAPDVLACLRAVSVAQLLNADPPPPNDRVGNLRISVDGGFLPDQPRNLYTSGTFSHVPYILGSNFDEGTLFFIGAPEITEEEYTATLFARFGANAPAVEALYPAHRYGTPLDTLIRLTGDGTLVCSTYDVAQRVSEAKGRAYAYTFARVPPLSFINLLDLGAFHGLEIGYVFGSATPPTLTDADLATAMQGYWSSFATRGKPRLKGSPGWPRFKTKSWRMLGFGDEVTKDKAYKQAECAFWRQLYETGSY